MTGVSERDESAAGLEGTKIPVQPSQGRPRRRRPASVAAPLVLAFVLAAVSLYLALGDQEAHRVMVATGDVQPGEEVTAGMFDTVEVGAADAVVDTLLRRDELGEVKGWTVANPLGAGELVSRSDLQPASAPSQLRAMSLPMDPQRAVAGDLSRGDRVDVAAVVDGDASYVATDLPVLSVTSPGGEGLASAQRFAVTVAVDEETGLALSRALEADTVNVLRATGAAAAEARPEILDQLNEELTAGKPSDRPEDPAASAAPEP